MDLGTARDLRLMSDEFFEEALKMETKVSTLSRADVRSPVSLPQQSRRK
jgi:hypothetical protein